MSAPVITRGLPMSIAAFFDFLDARPDTERWELIDGEPVMMVGGKRAHSIISGNIFAALRQVAMQRGCEAHTNDFFASGGPFSGFLAAPDVFVRCGPLDDDARLAEDPVIVVEVLSPSTIRHDRVRKFDRYTAIQSLRQIVLVYQDEMRVESFVREGEDWPMTVLRARDQNLPLPSLDASLPLTEIYVGTALA
jgi:Uma2 family endonuclease